MKLTSNLISGIVILFFVFVSADDSNDWWKSSILYEIFIRSFKDSDGDGTGDLNGITTKLDHFVHLGIDSIYLTPFYKSPMDDMGYDVSNYTEVDPMFGNMNDFERLVHEVENRGMKIVIDLVINHCSDNHEWFKKSVNKIKPYDEYFIWKDAKGFDKNGEPIPPNNWISVFGGSAWEWNANRKQFYLHQFGRQQPDFKLRNTNVKNEMKKILEFWFVKGVHGFRIDAPKHFYEDEHFRDEPFLNTKKHKTGGFTYNDFNHIYTTDLWETYEFINELRLFTDQLQKTRGGIERIFVAEAYTDMNNTMAYYGTKHFKVTHYPFNFGLVSLENPVTANEIDSKIMKWITNMPKGETPNWNLENHDHRRMNSKTSKEHATIILMNVMMLPGVVYLYYGQEIGMMNGLVRFDQIQDHLGGSEKKKFITRDYERSPMQWDDTMNAGFTSNLEAYLPIDPTYWKLNVERQKAEHNSFYTMFKNLTRLRQTNTCKYGELKTQIVSKWMYIISRTLPGYPTYYVITNFGPEYETIDLLDYIVDDTSVLTVETSSANSGYIYKHKFKIDNPFPNLFVMKPFSGVVLSTIK
ncbi:hypothetical protein PGB90_007293 [Kerria lacca]